MGEGTITPCFVLSGGLGHLSGVFPKYRTSRRTSVSYFSPWRRKAQKSLERIRRTQLQHRNREPLRPLLDSNCPLAKEPVSFEGGQPDWIAQCMSRAVRIFGSRETSR